MWINVKTIPETGLNLADTVDLDGNQLLERDSHFLEAVDYAVLLKRDGQGIKAQGKLKTIVSLPCVRCLESFELKINSRFDLMLFPLELMDQKNAALDAEDMEYIFFEGGQIDLEKLLLEQVNLFIPFNPLCSPDCRGLCPNCGVNLNQDSCQCEESKNEIRFLFKK